MLGPHDTGTEHRPINYRIAHNGSKVIVIVDDHSFQGTATRMAHSFEELKVIGEKLKAIIAIEPTFKPLPRRRIPWTAPKVWASNSLQSVRQQHHNQQRRHQWQSKRQNTRHRR